MSGEFTSSGAQQHAGQGVRLTRFTGPAAVNCLPLESWVPGWVRTATPPLSRPCCKHAHRLHTGSHALLSTQVRVCCLQARRMPRGQQQRVTRAALAVSSSESPAPPTPAGRFTKLPTAHRPTRETGEHARRRSLQCHYSSEICPSVKAGAPCPQGDACAFAHNTFESWLHPDRCVWKESKQRQARAFAAACNLQAPLTTLTTAPASARPPAAAIAAGTAPHYASTAPPASARCVISADV
jgi:hypothetical protein